MTIDPGQLAAYLGAEYVVFGEPDIVLRIGKPACAVAPHELTENRIAPGEQPAGPCVVDRHATGSCAATST